MFKLGQKDFMVYMSSVITRLRKMERMGTLHVYRSTLNRIVDFMGDHSLSLRKSILCGFRPFRVISRDAG